MSCRLWGGSVHREWVLQRQWPQAADIFSWFGGMAGADLQMVNITLRVLSKPDVVVLPKIFRVCPAAFCFCCTSVSIWSLVFWGQPCQHAAHSSCAVVCGLLSPCPTPAMAIQPPRAGRRLSLLHATPALSIWVLPAGR